MERCRYRAFISYSRSDRQWAKVLQARLERFVLPQALRLIKPEVQHDRRPLKPIFRDEDELVPGQDLPERIRRGLEQSEYLIVVCSPRAAASEWVGKEIRDFIALGRGANILAVVVGGEPNAGMRGLASELECLPKELRFEPELTKEDAGKTTVGITDRPAEPLWVDWRETNHRNRPAFLRLVAALLSLSSLDDLVQKDRAYRRRRAALVWSVVGIAACCVLGLGADLMVQAHYEGVKEGNTLIALAGKSAQAGDLESSARYALLALKRAKRPLIGFDAGRAEDAVIGALLGNRRIGPPLAEPAGPNEWRALSADGRTLTIVAPGGQTRVLDTLTNQPVGPEFLLGPSGPYGRQAVLSGDGKVLATWTVNFRPQREAVVQVWDVLRGTMTRTIKIDDPPALEAVEISPDGRYLVASEWEGAQLEIHRFDLSSGGDFTLPGGAALGQGRGDGDSFEFSPDGALVAASSDVGTMVWSTETGDLVTPLITVGPDALAMALSPDRRTLVAGNSDSLELWDIQTRHDIGGGMESDSIGSLMFSKSGQWLGMISDKVAEVSQVVVEQDSEAHNDLRGGVHTDLGDAAIVIHHGERQLAFSSDEREIVTDDGSAIRRWKLNWYDRRQLLPGKEGIQDTVLSPDGRMVAVLTSGGQLKLLDVRSLLAHGPSAAVQMAVSYVGPPLTRLSSVAFSSRSSLMAFVAGGGRTVEVADWLTGQRWQVPGQNSVKAIAFTPDGKLLAVASGRHPDSSQPGNVQVWDVASHQPAGSVIEVRNSVDSLAFSPDGQRLALALDQAPIQVWDWNHHTLIASPPIQADRVFFLPDGHSLLASIPDSDSDYYWLQTWDIGSGRSPGQTVKSNLGDLLQVRFLRGGRRALLVGSYAAGFWDLQESLPIGESIGEQSGDSSGDSVYATASLTADESEVTAATSNGVLYTWKIGDSLHLSGRALVDAACRVLLPGDLSRMTKGELAAYPALDPRRDADACGR